MSASDYQISPGTYVRLRYAVFDEDGEPVEEGSHELDYVHGFGVLLPRIEAALEGRRALEKRRVTLAVEEAFGRRREEAVLECEPDEFPEDVAPGDRLEAETSDGGILVLRVLEVRPDAVIVDTNHPLAGQRVAFELEILEVRPASPAELATAERRALSEQGAEAACDGADRGSAVGLGPGPRSPEQPGQSPAGPLTPLIPLESLLRSPSRRYETEKFESRIPGDDES